MCCWLRQKQMVWVRACHCLHLPACSRDLLQELVCWYRSLWGLACW